MATAEANVPTKRTTLGGLLLIASAYAYLSGLIFVAGMSFGVDRLPASPHGDPFDAPGKANFADAFANWDGKWYTLIARDGYSYEPGQMSSVAFYPAFPMLGRAVAWVTGMPHGQALALASNVLLFAALILLMDYARRRFPSGPAYVADYSALAMALCPLAFFFRVAYTESLFVFLMVLAMYAMHRRWPVVWIALVVGLSTATRATGVALIPPLMFYIWTRQPELKRRLGTLAWALPLSCWGLAAYAGYLGYEFGNPLAFSDAQTGWRFRPQVSFGENVTAVLTLEPFFAAFDPNSPGYWGRFDRSLSPPFSLSWANPIFFLVACVLVVIGAWRRWLTLGEILLCAGLLVVPYLSRGYYSALQAHARYSLSAFPIFLVTGQILARLPSPIAAGLLALGAALMAVYAALFAGRFFLI